MIKCSGGFTSNGFTCEKNFVGEIPNRKGTSSFSILMAIKDEYCNMCCSYCCCHPAPLGVSGDNEYKADYDKMIAKIKECPLYKEGNNLHFDVWGGEPLYNLKALKEVVSVLRKEWPDCGITISSNGLLLGSKPIVDWILENKISVQLSHDGHGQWIRSGEVDPLEDEKILEGLKRIGDVGLFTAVNCTLSYYNYSFFKNIDYFIGHLKNIKCGYIKLNHIYNSDYNIEAINKKGRWQNGIDESLIGKPIGNLALRGRVLDDYMQEFFQLAMFFRDNPQTNSPFELFRSYIMEQSKRYGFVDESKGGNGSCRSFQSWKHNIEGNWKQDWTFVINTLGEYCECNLCETVEDPGSPLTAECEKCKYKNQKECHGCGSLKRPEKCEFLYKWCQTLEKLYLVDKWRNKSNGNNKQLKNC